MLYHPTTIILFAITALILAFKNDRIFNLIASILPIITAIIFFKYAESGSIGLANITLTYKITDYNKLISVSFFCVLLAANLYSIGQGKKLEIIFGSAYGAFAFLCLLADDYISMFVGLELMMVVSSAIIFIGGVRASLRSAKKYFMTHLVSSNMIIIGITHLITKSNDLTIVPVTTLLSDPNYSSPMLYIMLIGMLINIAAFPFSGWMVKYYPKASPSGFLYLISFTTKISILLMAKLFIGLSELKYVAIIMIAYSSFKAIMEENIFSLLCYLSIMAMGLMLLGISNGSDEAILAVTCYLFIHIIYKSLLSISAAILADEAKITNCQELKKINNKIVLFSIIIGIAMMVNIPLSSSFYVKLFLSHLFHDNLSYYTIIFMSLMTALALPTKRYFFSKESINIKLGIYSKASILFMLTILGIVGIFGTVIPVIQDATSFYSRELFNFDVLKQSIIICTALIMGTLYMTNRKDTKPISLTEAIANAFLGLYSNWLNIRVQKEETREPWAIENLEKQTSNKLKSIHNQQTAIFIVFTIFIVMLMVLTTSI
jgi:multicomponent Na+:H+ antiporter subunit D